MKRADNFNFQIVIGLAQFDPNGWIYLVMSFCNVKSAKNIFLIIFLFQFWAPKVSQNHQFLLLKGKSRQSNDNLRVKVITTFEKKAPYSKIHWTGFEPASYRSALNIMATKNFCMK